MASITQGTIISLHVLFTAGLVIVICENMSPILLFLLRDYTHGDANQETTEQEAEAEAEDRDRIIMTVILLPTISLLLQIPWLQDMWIISALGLFVYGAGVIGSTLYSAILTIRESLEEEGGGDGDEGVLFLPTENYDNEENDMSSHSSLLSTSLSIPNDLWEWKWNGIPTFVGSAVYALEGINLSLPTAHSMDDPHKAKLVVCTAVASYGLLTLSFASMGYAGGLGGSPGANHDSAEECDVVTNCIVPEELRTVIRVALSLALTIPIMLYPATEMLEVALMDWKQRYWQGKEDGGIVKDNQDKNGRQRKNRVIATQISLPLWRRSSSSSSSKDDDDAIQDTSGFPQSGRPGYLVDFYEDSVEGYGATEHDARGDNKKVQRIEVDTSDMSSGPQDAHHLHQKSWKLRVFLSLLVVFMGTTTKSFTLFSAFVGAVGLTFAGFILPPILYVAAMQRVGRTISWSMRVLLLILLLFGVLNMSIGGTRSLLNLIRGL